MRKFMNVPFMYPYMKNVCVKASDVALSWTWEKWVPSITSSSIKEYTSTSEYTSCIPEICHDYVAPGSYGQARRTGANNTINKLAANSSFSFDKFNWLDSLFSDFWDSGGFISESFVVFWWLVCVVCTFLLWGCSVVSLLLLRGDGVVSSFSPEGGDCSSLHWLASWYKSSGMASDVLHSGIV